MSCRIEEIRTELGANSWGRPARDRTRHSLGGPRGGVCCSLVISGSRSGLGAGPDPQWAGSNSPKGEARGRAWHPY